MKTFQVYLKGREDLVLVEGDKAKMDNIHLTITDDKGNTTGQFLVGELQGWDFFEKNKT